MNYVNNFGHIILLGIEFWVMTNIKSPVSTTTIIIELFHNLKNSIIHATVCSQKLPLSLVPGDPLSILYPYSFTLFWLSYKENGAECSLWIWLILLRKVLLKVIHFGDSVNSSFFVTEYCSPIWMFCSLFIHSLVEGPLGCF